MKPHEEELEDNNPGRWVDEVLREACDASAPRVYVRKPRRHVYWWCDEVEELRRQTIRARRLFGRSRSRGNRDEIDNARRIYKRKKAELNREIARAKERSWHELLAVIDEDPWGFPYKTIVKRLSTGSDMTEVLERDVLENLLSSLFPIGEELRAIDWEGERGFQWQNDWSVSLEEVRLALRGKKKIRTPPGLDGISAAIFKRLPRDMLERLAGCFSTCLRRGYFPDPWKISRLVLIPKGGPASDDPNATPKARPICLLSEVGKLFERIIISRLEHHMSENRVADLAEEQYGFRGGRSTCDALMKVKSHIREALGNNCVVLAIGIDVANAFNSISWNSISKALRWRKGFPPYLCRIIDAYLSNRWIEYIDVDGRIRRRQVLAGVPQGSVLGPTLWNLTFDVVVRSQRVPGCNIICYADDTLILATAPDTYYACELANRQIRRILRLIRDLGLKFGPQISEAKTESTLFSRRGLIGDPKIRVGKTEIRVANKMKYLGIILDSRLSFIPHIEYVEGKASKVLRSLGLLMPNLREPSQARRGLYYNVVMSILTYRAPVWGQEFIGSPRKQRPLRRIQRTAALRVTCAYRTVSLDAALVLAEFPSLPLVLGSRSRVYYRIAELKENDSLTVRASRLIKNEEHLRLHEEWRDYLSRPNLAGARTLEAIRPHMDAWLDRRRGGLTFRMTQLLTGHGCFSTFLHRIRKSPTRECFHCPGHVDSVEHTLMVCHS